ncbi:MAG TPA: prepilin-type N-terminal cleavage/methylation domain-containing protein [Acidimicrobiales bacterium]|nr:prepilin-type N-terminal cleavage/methylation domain-containing protein [Acidimicrobiales bacterium]
MLVSEVGDTLIEVLVAIVIIALTVTALLGALVTAITSSTTQQSLSTVDSVLNGFAQSALFEVQQSSVFKNCTRTAYRLIGAPTPASGPVGSVSTVFVTGFAAYHTLTVSLISGATSTPAAITNGSKTDSSGDATVTFTVPNGLAGAQTVSVSDGMATASPTAFTVGGTVKGTTPVGYSIAVDQVQQWDAQSSSWVSSSSPTCPMSGSQQIIVEAHAPDGSAGSVSFVALGSATTTVLVAATSSSTTPTLGDALTFTATVVPPNSTTAAPTGTIQWSFTQSPGSPACANSTLSTIAGTNTSKATCSVNPAQVGTYTVAAGYPAPGGSGNYLPGSGTGVITVGKAASSTTVTETSSPTPAQPGSKLTFTAAVGANPAVAGDPQPSGTVVWSITAPSGPNPTCANSQMSSGGTGTNTATCSVTNAVIGTYSASATYGGDGNYVSSASGPTTVGVSKATPTLSFTTTPQNPQPGSTFTVKVTINEPNGGANPTGTVTWTITPPSGAAPTCAISTLDNTGSGSCTVTSALNGTYTVSASYGGDGTYTAANGSTPVVVALAPAGLDIETVGNPQDNRPDSGDQIVFTYDEAMKVGTIQNGWAGGSEAVTAEFTRQGSQTQLTISCSGRRCNTINLGTVTLGDNSGTRYVNGFRTVDLNATMVMTTNAAGQTVVTVTLTLSSDSVSTVNGNTSLIWTPSANVTNSAGVASATTAVTEMNSPERNF